MVGNSLPGRLKLVAKALGVIFSIRISITSPGSAPLTPAPLGGLERGGKRVDGRRSPIPCSARASAVTGTAISAGTKPEPRRLT